MSNEAYAMIDHASRPPQVAAPARCGAQNTSSRLGWVRKPAATASHATLQVMPDDHSKLVPPLPIPNRTVKRLCADDSAATSVKVGHRQAFIEKPSSRKLEGFCFCTKNFMSTPLLSTLERGRHAQHGKIDPAIGFLDAAIREVLDSQTKIHSVTQ